MSASTATTDTPLRQYPSLIVRPSIELRAVSLPNGEASRSTVSSVRFHVSGYPETGYTYDQSGVDIVLHRSALHVSGTTNVVQLVKGRKVLTMQCGMHPYMQNWCYAIDNPYYAVTNLNGSFATDDPLAGTYRIKAWHPILGAEERELTVKPNETVSRDLSFGAK